MADGRVARLLEQVPMPARVKRLPRNEVGYPIPWFVATLDDGVRDFRIASADRLADALQLKLCWVCGGQLGVNVAFTVGPMCAVNRISSEPPSHRDCAVYSAKVCPFLSTPQMRRREGGKPEDETIPAAGAMLERNPGVALVWVTRAYRAFRPPMGNDGVLVSFGDPSEALWFARSEPATRVEVLDAFEAGLPALLEVCQLDADPEASKRDVWQQFQRALRLVPPVDRHELLREPAQQAEDGTWRARCACGERRSAATLGAAHDLVFQHVAESGGLIIVGGSGR